MGYLGDLFHAYKWIWAWAWVWAFDLDEQTATSTQGVSWSRTRVERYECNVQSNATGDTESGLERVDKVNER